MNKSESSEQSHMLAVLPYQIIYLPTRRAGGYGFHVDITPEFFEVLNSTQMNKELLESGARETVKEIYGKDKEPKSYSRPIIGWQDNLLHHIALPYGNAAGMGFTGDREEPGWTPNNIDDLAQMGVCLSIMTGYFNYAAVDLYFKNKTFIIADAKP